MLIQGAVGLLGFYFHLVADVRRAGPNLFDKMIYNAPVLVPLLFPDLVLLSFIGIWTLYWRLPSGVTSVDVGQQVRTAEEL